MTYEEWTQHQTLVEDEQFYRLQHEQPELWASPTAPSEPCPTQRTYKVVVSNDGFNFKTLTIEVAAGYLGLGERELYEQHVGLHYPDHFIVDAWAA